VSLKHFVAAAGIAAFAVGCSEGSGPFATDVQHTIDVPGNTVGTAGCTAIDLNSCFSILDNQFKILYERNNWAARRGEAVYRVVTNSNNELASVFRAESRTVEEATRYLDRFISQIAQARTTGDFGECWGSYIQGHAEWIRGKLVTGNVDVSDAPVMTCFVSPVASVTSVGNATNGVVLTINDNWHYTGDPYGIYVTNTYFVVNGPSGTITTQASTQTGPATITIADPLTTAPGTYSYSVVQCGDWGHCSAPVTATVTVAQTITSGDTPADPTCAHDNRNGTFVPAPGQPRCEKTIKLDLPNP
jgi:hypothetical protein